MSERTFVIVKPDAVKRGLVGEILSRFEKLGLKIVGAKMVWVDDELLGKHYNKDEAWFKKVGERTFEFWKQNGKDPGEELGITDPAQMGRQVQKWLFQFMKSGPVLALVLEGRHACALVKKHVGPTSSLEAPVGTIRGDYYYQSSQVSFGEQGVHNMVHCSGAPDEAEFETKLWFKESELHDYKRQGE
ncbi:MAG: nucleoside-diphosphate kinase [Candidatus Blackburnbacteria bacterium]|nr:nucleoside-diphosphate kinase [Candidatus Blackburnbacteria bacterium]